MAAPDLEKIVDCLNDLQRRGIIGLHAIGGAFAFIFYAEPINTRDLVSRAVPSRADAACERFSLPSTRSPSRYRQIDQRTD